MPSPQFHNGFRKYHRWMGFFLAGIMAVYALSGVLLVFRKTDFLKFEQVVERQLAPALAEDKLADELRIRDLAIVRQDAQTVYFDQGQYNLQSGLAQITVKDYPAPLAKMVKLHKATTDSPLFFLNISFGIILLFFVLSAFVMFMPRAPIYKNGLKIAAAGFLFALLVVVYGS